MKARLTKGKGKNFDLGADETARSSHLTVKTNKKTRIEDEKYLSRKDVPTSDVLNGRVDVKKTSGINQRSRVSLQVLVIPFPCKKPIYLFVFAFVKQLHIS